MLIKRFKIIILYLKVLFINKHRHIRKMIMIIYQKHKYFKNNSYNHWNKNIKENNKEILLEMYSIIKLRNNKK